MIDSLVWNSLLMIHEYLLLFIIFTRKFDNSFPDKKISQKSLNNNRPQMMVVNNNNQHFDYHEKWLYFQKKMLHRTIYQTILQYWETFFTTFVPQNAPPPPRKGFQIVIQCPLAFVKTNILHYTQQARIPIKIQFIKVALLLSRSMFWNF